MSMAWRLRRSDVGGQAAAQLLEPAAHPGLDGAQRDLQLARQVGVAQVAQVGQADDLTLVAVRAA